MTKKEYRAYLASEYWLNARKALIANVGSECERCFMPRWLAIIAYDQDLHVHHLNYQNLWHETPEDVEILCCRCHDLETFGRSDHRAVKTASCDYCGGPHFNIYADYCESCVSLSIISTWSLNQENCFEGGFLWETVADVIAHAFEDGDINAADFISRVRERREYYKARNKRVLASGEIF